MGAKTGNPPTLPRLSRQVWVSMHVGLFGLLGVGGWAARRCFLRS